MQPGLSVVLSAKISQFRQVHVMIELRFRYAIALLSAGSTI